MRPNARSAWLSPVAAFLSVLCLGAVLVSCTMVTGEYSSKVTEFEPEKVESRDRSYYEAQLADLPLRFDTISSIRLNNPGAEPTAVREAHLLRDHRNPKKDTLVVVFDNRRFVTVNARDMTLGAVSELVERTKWDPVLTNDAIVFVAEDGEFQEFYRSPLMGGKLRASDRFGLGVRPSAQPVAVGGSVVLPTTDRNTVQGWGDIQWQFPDEESIGKQRFRMVQMAPVADSETVYLVNNNNALYAIDGQSGDFRFSKDLGGVGRARTQPVIQDNLIYVGSDIGELQAIDRSGKVVWSYSTSQEGPIYDGIYVMDDWVFFHAGKRSYELVEGDDLAGLQSGRTTQSAGEYAIQEAPEELVALRFKRKQPYTLTERGASRDRGEADEWATDDDGNPIYDVDVLVAPDRPVWTIKDQGNMRVLLKTEKQLYVLFEEWNVPYTARERTRLKEDGRVVKDSEFRTYTRRVLQVIDLETGEVVRAGNQLYSWELPSEISFVMGSMDASDRAIYFVTRDGYLFKGFAQE